MRLFHVYYITVLYIDLNETSFNTQLKPKMDYVGINN